MRLIKILLFRRFTLNMSIFLILSLLITYLSNKVSKRIYCYKGWIYKERAWERNGRFYQEKFKVKLWKDRVPELGDFVKTVFPKKYIREYSEDYLTNYLIESCKAELTHWAIIFSALAYILWNDYRVTVSMFLFSFIINIPFVVIQRYNRPRIVQIMRQKGMEC